MSKILSDVAEIIDSLHKTPKYREKGFPMVRVVDVNNSFLELGNCFTVDENTCDEHNKNHIPQVGDVIITRVGSFGMLAYVNTNEKFCLGQNIAIISPKVNGKFLYYYLKSPFIQNIIYGNSGGSSYKCISLEEIKRLPYCDSKLDVEKIGDLLYRIDSKIENNNKINSELESMAKTIYDYWFLQFEFPNKEGKPYKLSGGKMVWNEELKKEIPAGWGVGNLYDIAYFINGLACQKYRPIDQNRKLPVIKITEMHEGITDSTEYVRNDIPEKNIVNDGDILFSWSATLETMIWTGGKGGLNQHIFKVVPKEYAKYYVYMQLSAYIINFVHMAEARKTTMGHITTDHLQQSRIAIPPKKIAEMYNKKVQDFFEKIISNNKQSRELILLRDFLLPLLMNGQVGFED